MISKALFFLGAFSIVPQVFASVSMSAPIGTTTCTAGQKCTISWSDDGKPPTLAQFGTAEVGVWAGNAQQQTELQSIQAGVNVATTAEIDFTPNPAIGPNSNVYFIRFTSQTAKDPNNPSFPAEAFSAKFTLAGMTGTFNATVAAQISGTTTPGGPAGPTVGAPPVSTPSSAAPTTSSSTPAPAASSASKSSSSAAPSKSTGAASHLLVGSGVASGALAALMALVL